MSEKTRREVLRNGSIVLGTIAAGSSKGVATPRKGEERLPEIEQKIMELYLKGRHEEAHTLMENEGIQYTEVTEKPDLQRESVQPVKPHDRRLNPTEGETSNTLAVFERLWEEDQYNAVYTWDLEEQGEVLSFYVPCTNDGAGIFWNENQWQPVGVGRDNFDTQDERVSYEEYSPNGGVLAEVNDPDPSANGNQDVWSAGFMTTLEDVGGEPDKYSIKGQYKHNYIDIRNNSCSNVDVSLSISYGNISLSASPDGSVMGWSMAAEGHAP